MALKSMVREIKRIKNGISKRGVESENFLYQSNSHLALDVSPIEPIRQGQWASLPHELLLDIICRVEESERYWPARSAVVFCASVCKSRHKRDHQDSSAMWNDHISYFIEAVNGKSKLLLAAKRIRRSNFVISLAGDDFSQASNKYVCKLRSNFWGTKFTIYDIQLSVFDETFSPSPALSQVSFETFILKNKTLIWDEQHNGWGADFMGRFRVETVRNFDLVVDRSHNVSPALQNWPVLHVGKQFRKDISYMYYAYPLSSLQAFAICLIRGI